MGIKPGTIDKTSEKQTEKDIILPGTGNIGGDYDLELGGYNGIISPGGDGDALGKLLCALGGSDEIIRVVRGGNHGLSGDAIGITKQPGDGI